MQQTRDVAVLFTRGWSCVVSMFPPFHTVPRTRTSSVRAIWQHVGKAQRLRSSCLLLGSTALSHVAFVLGRCPRARLLRIINRKQSLLVPIKCLVHLLVREGSLFCLPTKSRPPQTPFHPTWVPQFPVPTEPCTRDWLAVHHRLSHWRLRVMHQALEISPGRDSLPVTCKAAASDSSLGAGQPNRIILRTTEKAQLQLPVLDHLRDFIHASLAFAYLWTAVILRHRRDRDICDTAQVYHS
ncbi:hypothetical protein GGI42DRAFT_254439 [Trichoderma sp. SZMC 28013]